jgi:hypothetical protein
MSMQSMSIEYCVCSEHGRGGRIVRYCRQDPEILYLRPSDHAL